MLLDGKIYKKNIEGKEFWIYEERHIDGFTGMDYTKEFKFNSYFDAEHEARVRSRNKKYTGAFDRTYDKDGKPCYDEDKIEFTTYVEIDPYLNTKHYNEIIHQEEIEWKHSFIKKHITQRKKEFKYSKLPYHTFTKTKDETIIYEGFDWSEAEQAIKNFIKTKSLYKVKDGDVK